MASLLLVPFLALAGAPAASAAPRAWQAFPALVSLAIENGVVRARTGPDSTGRLHVVTYDPAANRWSRPVAERVAVVPDAARPLRLDQVLVAGGGLFDLHPDRDRLDLGDGFVLARRDTGFALLAGGVDRGWPVVTEDELDKWGKEVRLGLPRDFPEDQLRSMLAEGRLRNVPGPFVRVGDALWFGLAGGFAGGAGNLGGLVVYDIPLGTFRVVRHKFIADVAVTRLFALGDELWIGTGRHTPAGLEGLRGMLLHRPRRREWRQFAPENSRIAGDLVYDAAAEGRHVWVTTNQGVSRYDLERRLWSSWFWHPADEGGFELTRERPVDLAGEFDQP